MPTHGNNAPWHVGQGGQKITETARIRKHRLPPTSPDLNPIETLWAIMARKLYQGGKTYSSDAKLEIEVQKVWRDLPPGEDKHTRPLHPGQSHGSCVG
ncbi:hypothetical protein BLNAU_17139 [Blattamonas nauphoetae]|uniref:Tc1-like transposase DDE domain-containing protein n=1 Tax=Blattamonas nauphoetae TaxID=2049346 RepID=A0ABQ9X9J0_9EUKA|nr:hypothetical protein BLNAU_17139 [Blattamonas nauphoetae]